MNVDMQLMIPESSFTGTRREIHTFSSLVTHIVKENLILSDNPLEKKKKREFFKILEALQAGSQSKYPAPFSGLITGIKHQLKLPEEFICANK